MSPQPWQAVAIELECAGFTGLTHIQEKTREVSGTSCNSPPRPPRPPLCLPGERCPGVSRDRSLPCRFELHILPLFKFTSSHRLYIQQPAPSASSSSYELLVSCSLCQDPAELTTAIK
ncbi:unnamed protein product [Pleuronectes platessa]|uniref:Uncharacterized protein n=1 Tax=Pleuronectes platessa TaxID=8262 RepID=A0A9N7Y9I9_PLEPL|nr:unnamed protein product [Pleuronectes platessa]